MKTNFLFSLLTLMIVFVTSCTEKQTKIHVLSGDINYNFGEIPSQTSSLSGKEWLFKNAGNVNLKINKVESSSNIFKLMYDSVNTVGPNEYFPFRVFVSPGKTIGNFKEKICIYGNFEESPLELSVEGTIVESTSGNENKMDS